MGVRTSEEPAETRSRRRAGRPLGRRRGVAARRSCCCSCSCRQRPAHRRRRHAADRARGGQPGAGGQLRPRRVPRGRGAVRAHGRRAPRLDLSRRSPPSWPRPCSPLARAALRARRDGHGPGRQVGGLALLRRWPRRSCSWPSARAPPAARGGAGRGRCSRSAPASGPRARRSGSTRRPCSFLCAGAALPGARGGRRPPGRAARACPSPWRWPRATPTSPWSRCSRSGIAVRWPRRIPRLAALGAARRSLFVLAYHWAYFGSPCAHGFSRQRSARFSEPWGVGHLGLLVSPAKGLLVFTPRGRWSRSPGSCARSAAASAGWPRRWAAAVARALAAHGPLERVARRRELGPADDDGRAAAAVPLPARGAGPRCRGWPVLRRRVSVGRAGPGRVRLRLPLGAAATSAPAAAAHAALWDVGATARSRSTLQRRVVILAVPAVAGRQGVVREHPVVLFGPTRLARRPSPATAPRGRARRRRSATSTCERGARVRGRAAAPARALGRRLPARARRRAAAPPGAAHRRPRPGRALRRRAELLERRARAGRPTRSSGARSDRATRTTSPELGRRRPLVTLGPGRRRRPTSSRMALVAAPAEPMDAGRASP